jgi:hypothetical protein
MPTVRPWRRYSASWPRKRRNHTSIRPFPLFSTRLQLHHQRFKNKKVEILTASLISPDWTTVWRQCHQQNFVPKIATIGKALLFPSALESLGNNIGHGLTCETWWSNMHPYKSSLTGELPKDVCDTWENETKRQWTPSWASRCGSK